MFKIEEIIKATKGSLLSGKPGLRVTGISTDSRNIKPGELFIALKGKNFNGHDFLLRAAKKGAAAFLIERSFLDKKGGFLKRLPAGIAQIGVVDNLKALGDLALFWREKFPIPIIAVTGSCGKTTTKEMIGAVLSTRYKVLKTIGTENNFVGVPLNLLKLKSGHEIACIELGTNSFGEIERLTEIVKPNVGIITNIGQSHLEKLKNRQGVFKEKSALLKGLSKPAIALVNYDDPFLSSLKNNRKNTFGFGIDCPSDFVAGKFYSDKDFLKFSLGPAKQKFAIRTFGVHNIYNALAAIGIGIIFGVGQESIARKLRAFKFPAARFNIIKKKDFSIVDDTYNANPLSLRFALSSLALIKPKGKRILVIADMLELGQDAEKLHWQIGKQIGRGDIDFIISLGHLAANIVKGALENGFEKEKCFKSFEYKDAIEKLRAIIKKGDMILVKGSHAMRMERVVNFLIGLKKL